MPKIASVLKDEIVRLTRKEFRQQVERLKKQILGQRKQLTSLKQEIETLRRGVKAASKGSRQIEPVKADPKASTVAIRYSSAGLRKLRERFGLSRDAFAPLFGSQFAGHLQLGADEYAAAAGVPRKDRGLEEPE